MKNFKRNILSAICMWLYLPLHATTYYVSPSGKNSNSGASINSPWQTTSKINTKNFNGDTILFQGGFTFSGGLSFTQSDVGTSTKPILISSYGTGRATISTDSLTYGFYAYNTAGFKITNLNFKGPGSTKNDRSGIIFYLDKAATTLSYINISYSDVSGYKYSGISVGSWNNASGYRDVTIKNCTVRDNGLEGISTYAQTYYIHQNVYIGYNKVYNNMGIPDKTIGNSGSGIVIGGVKNATVEYCSVYNNGALHTNANGGPVGIWAYESSNVIFQYNESHHNKTGNSKDGGGFDLDGGCINSIIQYNYSHDNYGAGYLVAQYSGAPVSKNNIIRYNISENDARKNDYGAIHIWSYTSSIYIQGLDIYNNTIYITSVSGATPKGFYVRSGGMSGVNLRNNIFQTKGSMKLVYVPGTAGIAMQGNSYWPTGSPFSILWGSSVYSSLSAWQSGSGQEKLNGVSIGLQADPLYKDTTKGVTYNDATKLKNLPGYKLSSVSTLAGKGLDLKILFNLNVGTRDYWGNSLAGKTVFHVGAYQGTPVSSLLITEMDKNIPSETEEVNVGVYPNPLSGNSILQILGTFAGPVIIDLQTIDGKIVRKIYEGRLPSAFGNVIPLNAGDLPKGIYIVTIIHGNRVVCKKGVIKL